MAPGFQKWLGGRLKGEAVCSQKQHKIGSPASETSSGAAPKTWLFFAVEFAGWGLASGVYSWGLAGCVWPVVKNEKPHTLACATPVQQA